MMSQTHLRLLGTPFLQVGTQTYKLERKTAILLAYLCLERGVSRAKASKWLYPAADPARARANLRQLLNRLKGSAADLILGQENLSLSSDCSVDLVQLEKGAFEDWGEDSLTLLGSYDYLDCPEFDDWLLAAREDAERLVQVRRVKALLIQGDQAAHKQWLAKLEPLALKLAQLAALSPQFSLELASAVLELPVFDLLEAASLLEEGGVIRDQRLQPQLVRALKASISGSAAVLLHTRLATHTKGLSTWQRAQHWLYANETKKAHSSLLAAFEQSKALDLKRSLAFQAAWVAQSATQTHQALLALEQVAQESKDNALWDAVLARLEPAVALLEEETNDASLALELILRKATKAFAQGEQARAKEFALSCLSTADGLVLDLFSERACLILGQILASEGGLEQAKAHFQRVSESSLDALRLRGLNAVASLAVMSGESELSYAKHKEALNLARRIGDTQMELILLNNLAATGERLVDYEGALTRLQEIAVLQNRLNLDDQRVSNLINTSLLKTKQGVLGAAWHHARSALKLAQDIDLIPSLARAQFALGVVERRVGHAEAAGAALKTALDLFGTMNHERFCLLCDLNLKMLALELNTDLDLAELLDTIAATATWDKQLATWFYLELALLSQQPFLVKTFAERAKKLASNAHIDMVLRLALFKLYMLEETVTPEHATKLEARLAGQGFLETGLAHAFLQQAFSERSNAALKTRLEFEVEGLSAERAKRRWSYYQRRLPASDAPVTPPF